MIVWVTGASGGIGSVIVTYLEDAGHEVYAMDSTDADVTQKGELDIYVRMLPKPPTALVYAAGINHLDWSKDISTVSMNMVYDTNVTGLVRCLQVAPTLERIVVIGSDAARRPMRTSIAYNASKAALEAAVRVIARERAIDGVTINIVSPGLITGTAMTDYVLDRTREIRPRLDLAGYMIDNIPAGQPGRKADVAKVVKWLLDEEAAPSYLNGAVIDVNGAR